MKNRSKIICIMCLTIMLITNFSLGEGFAKEKPSDLKQFVIEATQKDVNMNEVDNKLVKMGATQEDLNRMSIFQKKVLAKFYDKHNGKAVLLKSDEKNEVGIESLSNLSIYGGASYDGSDSNYKYAGIMWASSCDTSLEKAGIGTAFSDNWNIIDHEAITRYNDFWGNYIYEYGELIDATPEAGVAYGYDNYSSWTDDVGWTLEVNLRRPVADSGTTDVVGKCCYSAEDDITLGANISISPSITFTPSNSVYQKAETDYFNY